MALAIALVSEPSSADSAPLTYSAPNECSQRAELIHAIERRLSGSKAALGPGDLALELRVDTAGALFLGTIRVGADEPRRLTGNTCAEVLRAAAIVMASRIVKERESHQATPEPRSPAIPSASEAAFPPKETQGDSIRYQPLESRRTLPTRTSPPTVAPTKALWTIGAGGTSRFALAPHLAWGPFVEGELVQSVWRLHLGVERVATGTFEASPAHAAVSLLSVRPGGCVHLPARSVEPRACLGLDLGWFEAEGVASGPIVAGDRASRPWFGAGPALGLRFRLPAPFELDLAAGLQIPLQRGRLVFETPRRLVHTTGAVLPSVSASVRAFFEGSKVRSRGIAR